MPSSISQGFVFTTAMVLSTTLLYLAFSRQKISPPFHSNKQLLRSCIYSEEKKKERKKNKKKVKFAENVMVKEVERYSKEEKERKQNRVSLSSIDCRNQIPEMPANRTALYNGILRDRVQRIASCH